MTVSEWKVYPCVTCALRLHECCGVGCSRWNDSKTERSPSFFLAWGGVQTVILFVSTHTAEPTARPSSKMWQYLATEQHCCTSLKSNFKGYNLPGQVMTPSASLLRWQLCCLLEQRIHSGLFIYSPSLYCDWCWRWIVAIKTDTERAGWGGGWSEWERLCVKWSSQVVFETDLPCGAANAFSVYMSAHAIGTDCVSVLRRAVSFT